MDADTRALAERVSKIDFRLALVEKMINNVDLTPAKIEAGVMILESYVTDIALGRDSDFGEIVTRIYKAMRDAC